MLLVAMMRRNACYRRAKDVVAFCKGGHLEEGHGAKRFAGRNITAHASTCIVETRVAGDGLQIIALCVSQHGPLLASQVKARASSKITH